MHSDMEWIKLDRVRAGYGRIEVLKGDTLSLNGPGLILVLGPNGAGKTTLLKVVAGLLKPWSGRVLIMGVDVTGSPSKASRYVLYVPQLRPSPPSYPVTPLEYVECVLKAMGVDRARDRAIEALELVGLDRECWNRDVRKLSGGEMQRVFLAPTLVVKKSILLLDEPLASVDPKWKGDLVKVIASRARESLVIVTSHDPTPYLPFVKEVILMDKRVVAHGPPKEVLKLELLRQVYGSSAIPVEKHTHLADQHVWSY